MEWRQWGWFSGFKLIEEKNGPRVCLTLKISPKKEEQLTKPWKKTLIIKLSRREIGFGTLEPKLH